MEKLPKRQEQWPITKLSSLEIHQSLSLIRIDGKKITVATPHEKCISGDQVQLSSLVTSNPKILKEDVDIQVGRFKATGTIVKQEEGDIENEKVVKLIQLIIIEIFEWYGKEAKPAQIRSLAETIYNNWYWLKLTELKLFLERMKSGYYPQMHNMAPAVLMERLGQFAEESWEIRESIGGNDNLKFDDDTPREYSRNKESQKLASQIYQFNKDFNQNAENK